MLPLLPPSAIHENECEKINVIHLSKKLWMVPSSEFLSQFVEWRKSRLHIQNSSFLTIIKFMLQNVKNYCCTLLRLLFFGGVEAAISGGASFCRTFRPFPAVFSGISSHETILSLRNEELLDIGDRSKKSKNALNGCNKALHVLDLWKGIRRFK